MGGKFATTARRKAPGLRRELALAKELAVQAGDLAVRYREGGDLQVELKDGDEPVSVADRKASELIVYGLREEFPDDIIISEENPDDLRRLKATRVWYIDPIDGTKDFIRGESGFCVMIGLCIDAVPVLGVLYQPTSKQTFWASTGQGAWLGGLDGNAFRLHVSGISDLENSRLVASKSHRGPELDEVKTVLGIDNEHNIGSVGLKLGLISAGERDLYVNPSPNCKTWDTCGPEAILVEAGGVMTDLFGQPLRYDVKDIGRPKGMVASNSRIHADAIAKLGPLFAGRV